MQQPNTIIAKKKNECVSEELHGKAASGKANDIDITCNNDRNYEMAHNIENREQSLPEDMEDIENYIQLDISYNDNSKDMAHHNNNDQQSFAEDIDEKLEEEEKELDMDTPQLLDYLYKKYYAQWHNPMEVKTKFENDIKYNYKDFLPLVKITTTQIRPLQHRQCSKNQSPYIKHCPDTQGTITKFIYSNEKFVQSNTETVMTQDSCKKQNIRTIKIWTCSVCRNIFRRCEAIFHCLYAHNGGRHCFFCVYVGFSYDSYCNHTCFMGPTFRLLDGYIEIKFGYARYHAFATFLMSPQKVTIMYVGISSASTALEASKNQERVSKKAINAKYSRKRSVDTTPFNSRTLQAEAGGVESIGCTSYIQLLTIAMAKHLTFCFTKKHFSFIYLEVATIL